MRGRTIKRTGNACAPVGGGCEGVLKQQQQQQGASRSPGAMGCAGTLSFWLWTSSRAGEGQPCHSWGQCWLVAGAGESWSLGCVCVAAEPGAKDKTHAFCPETRQLHATRGSPETLLHSPQAHLRSYCVPEPGLPVGVQQPHALQH
jgi:hypothetical protein